MSEEQKIEIKNCPFCDGDPFIQHHGISCIKCHAYLPEYSGEQSHKALERWNTRSEELKIEKIKKRIEYLIQINQALNMHDRNIDLFHILEEIESGEIYE